MKTVKHSTSLLLTTATLVVGLTACGQKSSPENKSRLDINAIAARNATPKIVAEDLALAGEQLMSAETFVYADQVFGRALEVDKNNSRAQFYKNALAPVMALKGIATRVGPALPAEDKQRLDVQIAQTPASATKTFLLDGKADIKSEQDAQEIIDGVIQGFNSFREYLKNSKNEEITVHAPSYLHRKMREREKQNCVVQEVSSGVFEFTNCDLSTAYDITLNRADKEALQQIVAGYQVYLSILNAYRMDGVRTLAELKTRSHLSANFVQDYLIAQPEWGALRDPRLLTSVLDMGMDAVKGIRWMEANQATLCPKGISEKSSRTQSRFKDSLCMKDETAVNHSLAVAEALLGGGTTVIKTVENDSVYIRPAALFSAPIRSLKSQLPIRTNDCGMLTYAQDTTVGGLFPNGDLHRVFTEKCLAVDSEADVNSRY